MPEFSTRSGGHFIIHAPWGRLEIPTGGSYVTSDEREIAALRSTAEVVEGKAGSVDARQALLDEQTRTEALSRPGDAKSTPLTRPSAPQVSSAHEKRPHAAHVKPEAKVDDEDEKKDEKDVEVHKAEEAPTESK